MVKLSQPQAKKIAGEYLTTLRRRIPVDKAILFGSVARGTGGQNSDIDLIVISDWFKKMRFIDRLILLSRARGDRFLDWPMDILGYTQEEFGRLSRTSTVLTEAKKDGVEIR